MTTSCFEHHHTKKARNAYKDLRGAVPSLDENFKIASPSSCSQNLSAVPKSKAQRSQASESSRMLNINAFFPNFHITVSWVRL